MKFFEALDGFILDKIFQRVSDFFQKTTGKTCFFLARIVFILSASILALVVISKIYLYKDSGFMMVGFIFFVPAIALCLETAGYIQSEEKEFFDGDRGEQMANSLRIRLFPVRVFIWFWDIYLFSLMYGEYADCPLAAICFHGYYLSLTVSIYLASCNPLPPGKSKIGEWVKALRERMARKTVPSLASASFFIRP